MNQQYENLISPNNTSPIYFVDQDAEYTGHRFCREGVNEPDTENVDTWFFNTKSTQMGAKASDFAGMDAQTCLATAGDRYVSQILFIPGFSLGYDEALTFETTLGWIYSTNATFPKKQH